MNPYSTALILLLFTFTIQAQPLIFKNGVIPTPPPGVETLVAYIDIENPADVEAIIDQISSPEFEKIEMHLSEIKNGVAKMTPQTQLVIPAKSTLKLEQGGLHLMLIKPRKQLLTGDLVPLTLIQTDHTKHIIEVSVKRLKTPATHHHH